MEFLSCCTLIYRKFSYSIEAFVISDDDGVDSIQPALINTRK
jgi:hypothetical protein